MSEESKDLSAAKELYKLSYGIFPSPSDSMHYQGKVVTREDFESLSEQDLDS